MIERAGRRVRVKLAGALRVSEARALAAELTAVCDEVAAEVEGIELEPMVDDLRGVAGGEQAAWDLARMLVEAGYHLPTSAIPEREPADDAVTARLDGLAAAVAQLIERVAELEDTAKTKTAKQ